MIPLYKKFILSVLEGEKNTFSTREALEWLDQNKSDPTKKSWPQAVQTQIIKPCLDHSLVVRTEKGFYHLTAKAIDLIYSQSITEETKEDKEWNEYIQKKIKEADLREKSEKGRDQ